MFSRPVWSGTPILNLDTHVLLFSLQGHLEPAEERLLQSHEWSIAAIVLWEIAKLAQLKRISLDLEDPTVTRALSRIQVWPLSREIAQQSTRLDFKSDPADELIAATSVVHQVPLLTRDSRILASSIVPFAK